MTLIENDWLRSLPEQTQAKLLKAIKYKHYQSEQLIHRKGDAAEGLYCVINGAVKVYSITQQGHEFVFTHLQPGHWFGEVAILDGGTRTHDAAAVADTTLALIPMSIIGQLCNDDPSLYQSLVSILCAHCRMAFNAVDNMLVHTNEQRLASILLQTAQQQATQQLQLSQENLGKQVGISRQSINKILQKWQRRGWINLLYRKVCIVDVNAIQACLRGDF